MVPIASCICIAYEISLLWVGYCELNSIIYLEQFMCTRNCMWIRFEWYCCCILKLKFCPEFIMHI